MHVYLDNQRLDARHAHTVIAAVAAAREVAEVSGRIIIELTVDGQSWADDTLHTSPAAQEPAGEVRILSAEPKALVSNALRDLAEVVDQVRELQCSAALALAQGNVTDALDELGEAIAGWDMICRGVTDGLALMSIDAEGSSISTAAGERPLGVCVGELKHHLVELRNGVQTQDWSSLADILEGEMSEQADRWHGILSQLAQHVSAYLRPTS